MINVLRATEEWQRAGAYYVRIQGMNRQHGISLREEFDDNDKDGTNYIVLLDGDYPIATCRFYETDKDTVLIGRVVVLPEYRGNQYGRRVITEAEKWVKELGYGKININARVEAVGFYKKLDYTQVDGKTIKGTTFDCIKMEKALG